MDTSRPLAIVDSGVDYLTCTFDRFALHTRLAFRVESIFRNEVRQGNIKRPWRMSGYDGWRCGGLEFGVREDSTIVRLSGPTAQVYWRRVGQLSTNCSRIDLQATVLYDREPNETLRRHAREMMRWTKERKKRPAVTVWADETGIGTLYTGKRQSSLFGRIYDKGKQSGVAALKGLVRYELELKKDDAKSCLAELLLRGASCEFAVSKCQWLFKNRGAGLWWTSDVERLNRRHAPPSDIARKLRWLREDVRSTVAQLIALGYEGQVRDALGLPESILRDDNSS